MRWLYPIFWWLVVVWIADPASPTPANFLTLLDDALDATTPTEVCNFGVTGIGPAEYLHLWRTEACRSLAMRRCSGSESVGTSRRRSIGMHRAISCSPGSPHSGIPCLDLLSALRTAAREGPVHAPRDIHWNERGNGAAAAALGRWLSGG